MSSWRHALREFQRRPGRSLLSLMSIVIAVAAIVAVTSATATTREAYQQVFQALAGRADLEVVARGSSSFKENIAESIRPLKGIESVVPVLRRATILYSNDVKAKVLAAGFAPGEPESIAGFEVVDGRLPEGADEIAIERDLASSLRLKVGDEVRLLTSRSLRPQPHKITGLLALESAVRLHEGGMVLLPLDRLQRLFKAVGEVDAMHLFLKDAKQAPQVMAEVEPLLPEALRVRVPSSRSGQAEETLLLTEVSLDMASALSFTTAVFIALSVFLMNVGERRRQLSIMRAVGATRWQILTMVGREALLMGIAGTVIGIPIGVYGGGMLIQSMAALLQTHLPPTPDLRWAVITGAILGPAICLIAAWYPARKASQVSPLEGMRPVVTMKPNRGQGSKAAVGVVGLLISSLAAIGSARGDLPIWMAVFGAILSLISLVLLLPIALQPAVNLAAGPLVRVMGLEGGMAQRLVLRHAGRSALTIGVLFIAVSASIGTSNALFSITDDINTWYERTFTADFLIRTMMPDASGQEAANIPESLRDDILALDGVERAEAVRFMRVEADDKDAVMLTREFKLYQQVPLDILGGSSEEVLAKLQAGEAVVATVLAERIGVRPGGEMKITLGDKSHTFRVAALATEYAFGGSVIYMDRDMAAKVFQIEGVDSFLITARSDKLAALEPQLKELTDKHGLLLQSFSDLVQLIDGMVTGVTGGLWVLLTLGLVVGALGVVNTLTMNVLEQTRELGMLRAIGMRRAQVIKTVLGQAAFIGILGIVGGAVSGLFLARTINLCLGSLFGHYVEFAVRPSFIIALAVVSLIVVMLSALFPARRAAAINAIEAMRQD